MGVQLMVLVRRLLRYGTVSIVSTAISMSVLGALVFTGAMAAGWANIVATSAGIAPSFELNRRWVWGKTGRRSVATEIGPFSALTFAGLVLSTVAVAVVAQWAASMGLDPTATTVAVELASVAAFGSLWLVQFAILDRVLFKPALVA
jgi:putative flippase GtrA